MWLSTDYGRCPRCGNLLRSVPRNSRLKNSNKKYTLDEARQIFERFLNRGYSHDEAAEATFAITGLRPEVEAIARELAAIRQTLASLTVVETKMEKRVIAPAPPAEQPEQTPKTGNLPSFLADNPWVAILSRRGQEP
jgi:uncharacterized C2H2 Zn-finger protein